MFDLANLYPKAISALVLGLLMGLLPSSACADNGTSRSSDDTGAALILIKTSAEHEKSYREMLNYTIRRTNDLTRLEPDIARRLGRTSSNMSLIGHADSRDGHIELTGNIRGEDARLSKLFDSSQYDRASVWVRASFARGDNAQNDFDRSLVFMGLDYQLDKNTLIGLLGQFDLADETSASGRRFREGWLAGPYLISRLTDGLVFDGRLAWGQAQNNADLDAVNTGELGADRMVLKSQVSGNFKMQDWKVNPAISVLYFREDLVPPDDIAWMTRPVDDVTLGRLSFGPGASTTFMFDHSIEMTPRLRVQGTWDFDQAERVDVTTGAPTGSDILRARLDGGIEARLSDKKRLLVDGFYDGIGVAGFDAYGIKVGMSVVLN